MPEITVIITAYKLEKMLPVCFEQLLGQTFQDFEIVVVDDCSPDGTVQVISRYAELYPEKIHPVLLKTNLGHPGKVRNAALDSGLCHGKYVVFLDGDDPVEPDYLESLYRACEENDAEMAVCSYDRVEQSTGHVLCHELVWIRDTIPLPPRDDRVAFLNGALWNRMFRRDRIGDLRCTSIQGGEDLEFGLRILQRCNRIACVPRELIHYQVRSGSVSKSVPEESMHALAQTLASQYEAAQPEWKDTLALISFLHVGLSMALWLEENPAVDSSHYLRWCRQHMKTQYGFYHGIKSLRLRWLLKRGIKGAVIWAALQMHRLNCFWLALWANQVIRRVFHIDIKF